MNQPKDNITEIRGLKARVHIGSCAQAPAIFLVHGRAGSFDSMSTFRRSFPPESHFFLLQAPYPDDIGGWSWWDVSADAETQRQRQEEASQLVSEFIVEAIEHFSLKSQVVVACGFSQGAATLSHALQRAPELFDGVGLLAGFVLQPQQPPQLLGKTLPSVFMSHGSEDDVVPIEKAREGAAYLTSHSYHVSFHDDPVGHKVGIEGMRALKDWALELCISS